ncbi:MAG TPA: AAA family ATPase, partial [Clostridiales bacterium]|nr:AAA family ATPase [Clostridiales bacterium]
MYIGGIEIKGFGKLKNRSFSFGRGMNVIYGTNEAGKSTIQSFITAMFYGLKGGRSSGTGIPSPLKRFMPWDGLPYGGAITYTIDNGDSFRIERDFFRNTIAVYDSSYNDITSSFNFGRDRLPMVGEAHLGMDESTFESTVLIRQMEVRLDNGSSSVLAARLVNMDSPDIDGLVFQRAEAVLTNAVKNKVGTERSRTQPLDKLQSELKRLETEYKALAERQREKEKLLQELSEIKAGLRRLEAQEHRLVKIGELIGTRKRIDDGMKKEARLSETVKQISEIESTIGKLHSPDDSGGKTTQKHDETGAVQPGRYRPGMTSKAMIAFRIVLLLLCAAVLLASAVLMFAPAGSEFAAVPIPPYVYAAAMPICVLIGAMLIKGILDERKNIGEKAGPTADGMSAGGVAEEGADVTAGEIGEKLAALETAKRNLLS